MLPAFSISLVIPFSQFFLYFFAEALIFLLRSTTQSLIRNRAATKKLLRENKDKAKQHIYATELWDLRRKIKASAKKDKKNWLKGITKEIEKAGNTGNSKKSSSKSRNSQGNKDGIDFAAHQKQGESDGVTNH